MTKHLSLIIIGLVSILHSDSRGQDSLKIQSLDLRTPPSPVFVLLGMEPTSIDKPTTPRAVAASFISTFQQGGAVEVAPYWLSSHPKLRFDDYYNAGIGQTILQTLSFSFATTPGSKDVDSLGTRIGLGARWMFTSGDARDTLKILRKSLLEVQSRILDTEDTTLTRQLKDEARTIALAIQREDKMRIGFRLEMATAMSVNFIEDDFSRGTFDRWGAWLTGGYLLDKPSLDFLAVARVIGNRSPDGSQKAFDFGVRLVTLQSDFSISIEYVNRSEITTSGTSQMDNGTTGTFFLKNTYRLTGNLEYKYSKDASVYVSFGRNYANTNTSNDPLVAQVGINFGFGQIPLLDPR